MHNPLDEEWSFMEDKTKLTEEELDYAFYAVGREAEEESILFTECWMLRRSLMKDFSILQKLLGVSDERYNQLVELLHENTVPKKRAG